MGLLTSTEGRKRIKNLAKENADTLAKITRSKQLVPYIGLTGHNNLGDDVMYEAYQALLAPFELVPYRKDAQLIQKIAKIAGRPFAPFAVLGGGTLINDGEVWPNRVEQLLSEGKHMFCLGTGAESSAFYGQKDEDNKLLKRWVELLRQFEFVGVRGPQSKAILEKAGAKGVKIVGDPALALTKEHITRPKSQNIIGITYGDVPGNPMWGDPKAYRQELKKVIRTLIDQGMKIRLLPVWDIDLPSNRSLLREINDPNCVMVEAFDSLESFSRQVQQCDLFIGQKLHSTIIAIMNRVPSIMVEYRPKCRDFMASVGYEKYIMKTSEFDLKSFTRMHEHLQKHASQTIPQSEARMLEYKHLQFDQAEKLKTRLAA